MSTHASQLLVNSDSTPEPVQPASCMACASALRSCDGPRLFDTRFGIPGVWSLSRCSQCGLEHLQPVPAPAELKDLYERYYNFGGEKGTLYIRLRHWFFTSILHRIWAGLDGDISFYTRKGNGRLLDIGCNEGRGLAIYTANGFEVEGLELNEAAAAIARKGGYPVRTQLLEEFTPTKRFDVAVLSNVLEHSLDPALMLRDVHRVLRPGGEVWISCPNARSWMRPLFGGGWINWHAPFHIVHFTPDTLQSLLERCGFHDVKIRQISPSLWSTGSIIASLFARPGKPTRQLRNPVLVLGFMLISRFLCFPALWLGNRLGRGDCLITTAAAASTEPRTIS